MANAYKLFNGDTVIEEDGNILVSDSHTGTPVTKTKENSYVDVPLSSSEEVTTKASELSTGYGYSSANLFDQAAKILETSHSEDWFRTSYYRQEQLEREKMAYNLLYNAAKEQFNADMSLRSNLVSTWLNNELQNAGATRDVITLDERAENSMAETLVNAGAKSANTVLDAVAKGAVKFALTVL